MRVAVCVDLDLNAVGGVESHIYCLSEAMRQAGVQVDLYGRCSQGNAMPLDDCLSEHYDLIHTHGSAVNGSIRRILHRRDADVAHVHTLHGISWYYLTACKTWWNWRCYTSIVCERHAAWRADRVIAVSQLIAKGSHQLLRLPSGKVDVITNGFTPTLDVNPSQTRRRAWGVDSDETVVLFVGRGEDRVKGTALIESCLSELIDQGMRLRLLAVPGSGFGDAEWILKSGPHDLQEMADIYAGSDVFVNASLNEGMPLTLIEAMAAGMAVVAAPVGGIPELIRNGKNGLLTRKDRSDLKFQLSRLIESQSLRHQLGSAARHDVRNLTWNHIATQTFSTYEKALQKRRGRVTARSRTRGRGTVGPEPGASGATPGPAGT